MAEIHEMIFGKFLEMFPEYEDQVTLWISEDRYSIRILTEDEKCYIFTYGYDPDKARRERMHKRFERRR